MVLTFHKGDDLKKHAIGTFGVLVMSNGRRMNVMISEGRKYQFLSKERVEAATKRLSKAESRMKKLPFARARAEKRLKKAEIKMETASQRLARAEREAKNLSAARRALAEKRLKEAERR